MMEMLKMILIVSQHPAPQTDLFKSVAEFLKKYIFDYFYSKNF